MRSAVGCSRRRTWRGTGRVVARSETPERDIGPDGAECREEKKKRKVAGVFKGAKRTTALYRVKCPVAVNISL